MTTSSLPNDRIHRFTRLLSIFIIPFLIVAWIILYLLPQRSGELIAWPIKAGFLPLTHFASLPGIATRLH